MNPSSQALTSAGVNSGGAAGLITVSCIDSGVTGPSARSACAPNSESASSGARLLGLSHIVLTLRLTVRILPMVRIRIHPSRLDAQRLDPGLCIRRTFAYLHLDPCRQFLYSLQQRRGR